MIAVWEPVLVTDWAPPTTQTLARLPHPDTAQFWDPKRLLSRHIQETQETARWEPTPWLSRVCEDGEVIWDVVAIFPEDAIWKEAFPEPLFFDGTIVNVMDAFERALSEALSHRISHAR